MPFLLSQLGFPKVRHGGAEYDPYDSNEDDDTHDPRLPKPPKTREQVVADQKCRNKLLPLDEIKVHKPGLNIAFLLSQATVHGFAWAITVLSCLINPRLFEATILYPPGEIGVVPRIRPTQKRYLGHLRTLANAWQCLKPSIARPRVLGSYFEVKKKDNTARTVIDCRPLNAMCRTPKKVNLCSIAEFLLSVASLGSCWFLVGDFRQWYWQIRVPKEVQSLFGIAVVGYYFCSVSVPMGWSHSALFAQVCLLTIILMRPPRAAGQSDDDWDLGIDGAIFGSEMPPGVLRLKNKRGFIAGYYDNICVAVRNQHDGSLWRKRILGNAKMAGAVWHPDEILSKPSRSSVFLGVLIDGSGPVRWRHCPKKILKWLTWWTEPWPEDGTPPVIHARWVAKAVGIIVCDANIRLIPLFEITDAINSLKFIHEYYKLERKRDWYSQVSLPEELLAVLSVRMEAILKNEWHIPSVPSSAPLLWVAASDASDFAWGFVVLRGPSDCPMVSLSEDGSPGVSFPKTLKGARIFIKEMYAALKLITHVAALNSCHHLIELTLLMDNTAAMHCIRNWFSKNEAGNRLLKRIYEIAKGANIIIKVIWIGTDENPADEPSRLVEIKDWKCKQALDFVDGYWHYQHKGEQRRQKWCDVPECSSADIAFEREVAEEDPLNLCSNEDMDDERNAFDELHEELNSCHPKDLTEDEATKSFEYLWIELAL